MSREARMPEAIRAEQRPGGCVFRWRRFELPAQAAIVDLQAGGIPRQVARQPVRDLSFYGAQPLPPKTGDFFRRAE